ncbi:hypothetical protein [Paraburkholderia nemoris]|uniref:hypothetical protein n=1 Tax=Paraburkholderia nemoris TaxID=2793076 RepID=UPI001B8AC4D8|nr:hypothetical protein [Paraburkholderia nemoris]
MILFGLAWYCYDATLIAAEFGTPRVLVALASVLNFLLVLELYYAHDRGRRFYFIGGCLVLLLASVLYAGFDLHDLKDNLDPNTSSVRDYLALYGVGTLKEILSLGFAAIGAGVVGAAIMMPRPVPVDPTKDPVTLLNSLQANLSTLTSQVAVIAGNGAPLIVITPEEGAPPSPKVNSEVVATSPQP